MQYYQFYPRSGLHVPHDILRFDGYRNIIHWLQIKTLLSYWIIKD